VNLANEIAIAFANVFLLVAGFSNSSRDQYTSGRRTETDPRSMENLGESRAIYRIPPSTWESIFRASIQEVMAFGEHTIGCLFYAQSLNTPR
jgi:hypothetical protein